MKSSACSLARHLLIAILLLLFAGSNASAGTPLSKGLDRAYGKSGYAKLERAFDSPSRLAFDVADDGSVFLLATFDRTRKPSRLVRLTARGRLDRRFGVVQLPRRERMRDVLSDGAGGVLIANFDFSDGQGEAGSARLMRLNRRGNRDSSFGVGGVVPTGLIPAASALKRVERLSDGRIAITSTPAQPTPGPPDYLNDPTDLRVLGAEGRSLAPFDGDSVLSLPYRPRTIVSQPSAPGVIYIGSTFVEFTTPEPSYGDYTAKSFIAALLPSGLPDLSWGTNGLVEWTAVPPTVLKRFARVRSKFTERSRFLEPLVTTLPSGAFAITFAMEQLGPDGETGDSFYFWRTWLDSTGKTNPFGSDTYIGLNPDFLYLSEGEGLETGFEQPPNGSAIRYVTFVRDQVSRRSGTRRIEVEASRTTFRGRRNTRRCVNAVLKERNAAFGLLGMDSNRIFFATALGSRTAIATVPFARPFARCKF